jgi:hypothetical protein
VQQQSSSAYCFLPIEFSLALDATAGVTLSRKSREQAKRIAALDRRQLADTTMLA